MSQTPSQWSVYAVGWVESELEDVDAAPRQPDEGAPPARVHVLEPYRAALDGLSVGDELVLVTWLHHADRATMTVHPRGEPGRPLTGVFATRSPGRPNPLGLHSVELTGIDGTTITVDRLEAVSGTPVLDIKPALGQIAAR
jgi:tRNA-Thr(GGU) m(6)t(6)A37 methyltransferase TsaA